MNHDAPPGFLETPPEVAPVRAGEHLDWNRLEDYLRAHIGNLDGTMHVRQFPNGAANLTYLVEFDNRQLVVRRPPFGAIAPGAHDMRREYRALSLLWRHFDMAPRAYLFCDDQSVIGADFLVIEYRSGVVIWGAIPLSMRHHADVGRRIGGAVVDALAMLHTVQPDSVGLGDLGRPEGFVERQLAGWMRRWELAASSADEPLMPELGRRLWRALPQARRASILHNDFKLDNCQFDPSEPDRVKSIFDWDMATLGDPLVDLGTLLNYWPDPTDTEEDRPLHVPGVETFGLPTRSEVIERYALTTGSDPGEVRWYEAFACWKSAVVLQQLYDRYARGETADERMAAKRPLVGLQAQRAKTILDRASL